MKRKDTIRPNSSKKEYGSSDLVCSFCWRPSDGDNRRLIAGPDGVAICNECITLCVQTLDEDLHD